MGFPKNLNKKLEKRIGKNALRSLQPRSSLVDFSSNDYLGIAQSETVFNAAHQYVLEKGIMWNGATGSRLLSGNHSLYAIVEEELCEFHQSESVTLFNSGYDANIGFFSAVPQRGDVIIYDELIHASIRDGIKMSDAKAYKFKHNDLMHLEALLQKFEAITVVYVVTESVFSMDGDSPDLKAMVQLVNRYKRYFIVDEAHAVGIFGEKGTGLVREEVFARIITFGKALGCHGAAILGSTKLKEYIINFVRSFIYTTALPPHSLATILESYKEMQRTDLRNQLKKNIAFFKQEIERLGLEKVFIESDTAIHCCLITGNVHVKRIAEGIRAKGFEVKPILSPTVPQGQERIRFCLHAYNSTREITNVLETLRIFVVPPSARQT